MHTSANCESKFHYAGSHLVGQIRLKINKMQTVRSGVISYRYRSNGNDNSFGAPNYIICKYMYLLPHAAKEKKE